MVAPMGIVGTQIHNVGAGIARPFPPGFHRSPEPGCRNHRIRNSVRAPTKKPVGETPTGSALFDYVSGVTSGVGSATIVNTKVFGKAKKSPPRTLAVTMYLPGAVGMVLFA